MSFSRLHSGTFLTFFVVFLCLLCENTQAARNRCTWLYLLTQGGIGVKMQHTRWQLSKCPSGLVSHFQRDASGNRVEFPFSPYIINFTPRPSSILNRSQYTHVDVVAPCDKGAALSCGSAVVYYVVEPALVGLDALAAMKSITHPVRYIPERIHIPMGTSLTINTLVGVGACPNPSLEIINQNKGHYFTLMRDASDDFVLIFDSSSGNANEGEFAARIRIICNGDPSQVISFEQVVVVTPTLNLSLSESHSFNASLFPLQTNTVSVGEPRARICTLESLSHYNTDVLESSFRNRLNSLMPGGRTATVNSFALKVRCGKQDWASFVPRAARNLDLFEDAQPSDVCPGVFDYEYMLNADGTFTPKLSSLTARASVQTSSFCPTNQFTNASLVVQPKLGSISNFNSSQGTFFYAPFTPSTAGADIDFFNFTLVCNESPFTMCKATARISITSAPSNTTIYRNESNHITCKGSCPKGNNSTRKDGREVGSIDFDFSQSGKLLIYAYTTLDSLKSHFVTFIPFTNGSNYLTSASVLSKMLVAFEPSCLDRQSTEGMAADVILPDGGGLNILTDNYKLGDNYYQKFGGMHQQCDIYREDPCKFAPFMTPNMYRNSGGTPVVTWELYVDDCDATYVGTASVESLRALQNPDGTATFKLIDDTTLKGVVYMNTVTPVSLESPTQGSMVSHKAYDLNITIRSTIAVHTSEVEEAGKGAVHIVSDIQYAFGKDIVTNERLYAYSIHLYPRRIVDHKMVNIDTRDVFMQSSSLVYFEFASPNRLECPECTGTRMSCKGLGFGFETDCGRDGIVTFEAFNAAKFSFTHFTESGGNTYIFPRVISDIGGYYELVFTLRVNGWNSYNSVDAAPAGYYVIHVRLSNGQVFSVKVKQSDYVSLINDHYLRPQMCTSSPYWPVPDVLGNSTPVNPFNPFPFASNASEVVKDDYSVPKLLVHTSMCDAPFTHMDTDIYLPSLDAVLPDGGKLVKVSLCAYEQDYIFGVKDWVFVTIPSIKEKQDGTIVTSDTSSSTTRTFAELQYVLLKVLLNETIAVKVADLKADSYLSILLDGSAPLDNKLDDEQGNEYPFVSNKTDQYYSWKEVAPFLKYRRVSYAAVDTDDQGVTVPFSFVFTPGFLLGNESSINVPMSLQVSVKFTTYEGTARNTRVTNKSEEKFLYIFQVSHGISAATQFNVQAYKVAMIKLEGALGRKSATALFVFLLIAVISTLLASIYIEAKFKVIIHKSKYHPKNPEGPSGANHTRADNSSNSDNFDVEHDGSSSLPSPSMIDDSPMTDNNKGYSAPIKTEFGILGTEQQRVADASDVESKPSCEGVRCNTVYNLPIGEEQIRVQDDQIAKF